MHTFKGGKGSGGDKEKVDEITSGQDMLSEMETSLSHACITVR